MRPERLRSILPRVLKTMAAQTERTMSDEDIKPEVTKHGLPLCTESCPSHDGKRCRVLGQRPSRICEPAVEAMAERLEAMAGR